MHFLTDRQRDRPTKPFKVIVIGASQGGIDALERVVPKLPLELRAAVFIVLHIGSSTQSRLPQLLGQFGPMPAAWARHTEAIRPGRIYGAPPDRHMVPAAGYIRLVHGAKENHTRPAVDPLFDLRRSCYGPAVIGVVLGGNLVMGRRGPWPSRIAGNRHRSGSH